MNKYEQETIINFNKGDNIAYIFTYEKTWQEHLEGKVGLVPSYINSHGGREYEIDKSRIKMPRAKRKLSRKQKGVLVLAREARQSPKSIASRENLKH